MSGNSIGKSFTVTTFGESHGPALGCIVDGCPPGVPLAEADIQKDLERRRPGKSRHTTQRREPDSVKILSGVFEGLTTGTPIGLLIENVDQKSGDYRKIKDRFRPGHADYTYQQKYGIRDYRGGGRSSARETAMRVAAGAIARKYLRLRLGVEIRGYLRQLGPLVLDVVDLGTVDDNPFFCADPSRVPELEAYMDALRKEGNSIGARINVLAIGVPEGLGEPVFDKLEADIAHAMMGINAVRAVELGAGFAVVSQKGTEHRDEITPDGFRQNASGGILGGISTGQDILVSMALKPTSSIRLPGDTVDEEGEPVEVATTGRHDPCVGLRAAPIAEAMLAIVLMDHYLRNRAQNADVQSLTPAVEAGRAPILRAAEAMSSKDAYRVAIVGATGLVGETLLQILAERNFPVSELIPLASERSVGKTVSFAGKTHRVRDLAKFDFQGVDLGLFSAGGSVSGDHAPRAGAAGCIVIDNTSKFRYDDDIPLVVPEVNPAAIAGYPPRNIIANPNCSTIQMVVALKPIHDAVGITRINVATYQSVSGAGRRSVESLAAQTTQLLNGQPVETVGAAKQIAFNVVPHIDDFQDNGYTKEEMKMVWETRKILGDDAIQVNPTAVRVPVFFGHSEAVHVETRRKITAREVRALLERAPGVTVVDEARLGGYPTAVSDGANHDPVYVGRIREDISCERGINLWVVSDNIRKGAALNSVQIAELLIRDYI